MSKKRRREFRGKKDKDIERERKRGNSQIVRGQSSVKESVTLYEVDLSAEYSKSKGNTKHKVVCILCLYKIKHSSSETCFFDLSDYESHQLCFETSIAHMPKFNL